MPWFRLSTTSATLPPSSFAVATSLVAVHSIGVSAPTVNDFHLTG
jgi:hypothetical protein